MSQIYDDPNTYDYGLQFNYSVWTANTRLMLCNVPWDSGYRDVVRFNGRTGLNKYLDEQTGDVKVITNVTYHKVNEPVILDIPFNTALKYNYLKVTNQAQPIPGNDIARDFYYFVKHVEYIAPNATAFVLQLDVFQSFGYDVEFGNCYVERGHIGIANTEQMKNNGRDYLTQPEGMDLGSNYRTIATRTTKPMVASYTNTSGGREIDDPALYEARFHTLIVSAIDFESENFGTKEAPDFDAAPGGMINGIPSGASLYVTVADPIMIMKQLKSHPWISQGILAMYAIPNVATRYGWKLSDTITMSLSTSGGGADGWRPGNVHPDDSESDRPGRLPGMVGGGQTGGVAQPGPGQSKTFGFRKIMQVMGSTRRNVLFRDWRNSDEILTKIPSRYRHLKKFLTSPYMIIEMTNFAGSSIILNPENWAHTHAVLNERPQLAPPSPRITFNPQAYNAYPGSVTPVGHYGNDYIKVDGENWPLTGGNTMTFDDQGEYLNMSISVSNFPTFAITNDQSILTYAQNAHSISQSYASADWSQQKALTGMNTAYQQGYEGIDAANQSLNTSNAYSSAMTARGNALNTALLNSQFDQRNHMGWWNVGTSVLSGAIGAGSGQMASQIKGEGATSGTGGLIGLGAAQGLVDSSIAQAGQYMSQGWERDRLGLQNSYNTTNTELSNAHAVGQFGIKSGYQSYLLDSNYNLASYSAKGDYAMAIAGVDAKVRDLQAIQPSSVGTAGGDTNNLAYDGIMISLRWKMIDGSAIRRVGDYWLRYGYAVNMFLKPPKDMHCMSRFTYWKMQETYLVNTHIPEQFKDTIRGIFEKGVTVWRRPEYLGINPLHENEALGGISY